MALILSSLLVKIMADSAKRNQSVPIIGDFQKKYEKLSELLTAVNCVKILLRI